MCPSLTWVSEGMSDGTDAQRQGVQVQCNLGPLLPTSPGGDACDTLVGDPSWNRSPLELLTAVLQGL